MWVPVLPAVTLFHNTVTKICNLSGCICVPVLPAVTLLPKHSSVNLQFKLKYLCPCVACGSLCYPVTQTLSRKFAILAAGICVLCYLQLPLLPCYSNTVQ